MWKINEELLDADRIDKAGREALAYKDSGFHCTESLIRAVWPYVIPDRELSDDVMRVVMPFRGGMAATTGSHCGGLTVGIALSGAIYGRLTTDGDYKLAPSIARQYWKLFLEEFGTSNCTLMRRKKPGPEAPTTCGCIIVRSARLMVSYFDALKTDFPPLDEVYSWIVDRSQEPCHERVVPRKMNDET